MVEMDGNEELLDMKKLLATLAQSNTTLAQSNAQTQQLLASVIKKQNQVGSESSHEWTMTSIGAIESRILEFVYCPEEGSTFERWWSRHEDIFEVDLKDWDEVKKIRMLIRHVSVSVERTFTEAIAPSKWMDLKLKQVVDRMTTLFGDNTSLFDRRRTMFDLKMSQENIDDVRVLAARVNQTVENAQVGAASIDEWKVLTFLHSLDLSRYADVHLKMMQTAKQKGKECKLDDLLSVFNDVHQLKKDSRSVTEASRVVNYVNDHRPMESKFKKRTDHPRKGSSQSRQCYGCGNTKHMRAECPFKDASCIKCGKKGHIAKVCNSSMRADTVRVSTISTSDYRIRAKINGIESSIKIDTGADMTIVSEKTWRRIGEPACSTADCTATCANGKKLELMGKFKARTEYGGVKATGDMYVTRKNIDLFGKNFIKLLNLIKIREPVQSSKEVTTPQINMVWAMKEFPKVTASGSNRSRVDLMRPTMESDQVDQRMKDQFDKRHGSKDRWYSVGDCVYYRSQDGPNRFQWLPAVVTVKKGKVMFEIEIENSKWKQRAHANQLRKREGGVILNEQNRDSQLPLDVLLDSFELVEANREEIQMDLKDHGENSMSEFGANTEQVLEDETAASDYSTTTSTPASATPSRDPSPAKSPTPNEPRPQRERRPPTRLVIDPSKKTYKETKQ